MTSMIFAKSDFLRLKDIKINNSNLKDSTFIAAQGTDLVSMDNMEFLDTSVSA